MNRPTEHKPNEILAAAVGAIVEHGVTVSTAKVARAAGVSEGTLFNNFPTKQDLIDQLYVFLKQDMTAAISVIDHSRPLSEQLRTIWLRWYEWARSNRDEHTVMNLLHQSGLVSATAQEEGVRLLSPVGQVMSMVEQSGLLVDLPMSYLSAITQLHLDQAITHQFSDAQSDKAFDVLWKAITN